MVTAHARKTLLIMGVCAGLCVVQADDVVPANVQSDAHISVWVDNAPLNLFVSQLALITGRKAAIAGELEGLVSGRFNGSMVDTLSDVGDQYPVLFDLDDSTLSATSDAERSSATIAIGEASLDESLKARLLDGLIPGNSVEMREREVVVSGHPTFVNRTAKEVTSAAARLEQNTGESSAQKLVVMGDNTAMSGEVDATQDVQEPVIDAAAQLLVDDEIADAVGEDRSAEPSEPSEPSEPTSVVDSQSGGVQWVTDIPGYETF